MNNEDNTTDSTTKTTDLQGSETLLDVNQQTEDDWTHGDATNDVEVIDSQLEPSNENTDSVPDEIRIDGDVRDADSSGYASKAQDLAAEVASYFTGAHTTGDLLGFRVNKDQDPIRGGDHEAAANTTRRGVLQGLGAVSIAGYAGAGVLGREDEQPAGDSGDEPGVTLADLMDRQYSQAEAPGGREVEGGLIHLGEYADEIDDLSAGEVGQHILHMQNSDLYDDMANESEWQRIFRQAGDTGVMLEEDGSVLAYNMSAQESQRFDSQEFNSGGAAYEGPEGESFEDLYSELV